MAEQYTVQRGDNLSRIAQRFGTDLATILRLNPQFQSNPNLIHAGNIVNLPGAPAPTPAPTPTPTPSTPAPATNTTQPVIDKTAANGFGTDKTSDMDEIRRLQKSLYDESQTTRSREDIRQAYLDEFQAQIDAVNALYDTRVSDERVAGTGRLGQSRAISSRSGQLGTPRGNASKDKVTKANEEIISSINAERSVQIQNVYREVNKLSTAAYEAEQAAKRKGVEDYIGYLEKETERETVVADKILAAILEQGLDPEDITDEELTQMSSQVGIDADKLKTLLTAKKKAADKKLSDAEAKDLAEASAEDSKLLTPNEARQYGVPYGTTRGELKGTTIPASKSSTGSGTRRTTSTKKTTTTTPEGDEELSDEELLQQFIGGGTAGNTSGKTATLDGVPVPTRFDSDQSAAAFLASLRDSDSLTDRIYNYVIANRSNIFTRGRVRSTINSLMGQA